MPRLTNMFVEMDMVLPFTTRMIIGCAGFLERYRILLLIFIIGLIFFFKESKKNKVTKKTIDVFKLRLPIFGRFILYREIARFTRTLSLLLKNGVPVLHSLKITCEVIDNEIIKEEVRGIFSFVKTGSSLSKAIKKSSLFPKFVENMAAVGEEGGFLDRALLKTAKTYEMEINRTVKIMSSILEPVLILIMGAVVGFIVISMLLPIFQISLTAY